MSNRKNHNSILVLATLGVYLGLVLVGATPQVLAQAAMTRQFNVKDEVEVKDDLDKNPRKKSPAIGSYVDSVDRVITELSRLGKEGFDWNKDGHLGIESLSFSKIDDSPSFLGYGSFSSRVDPTIEICLQNVIHELFERRAKIENGDFHSYVADIVLSLSNGDLTLSAKVGDTHNRDNDVTLFFSDLRDSLQGSSSSKLYREKAIAESTTVSFKNDQVTIVTRLPRAGLDALLASGAK